VNQFLGWPPAVEGSGGRRTPFFRRGAIRLVQPPNSSARHAPHARSRSSPSAFRPGRRTDDAAASQPWAAGPRWWWSTCPGLILQHAVGE